MFSAILRQASQQSKCLTYVGTEGSEKFVPRQFR